MFKKLLKEGSKRASLTGKKKDGKDGKEEKVVVDDPAVILESEIQEEATATESVKVGEELEVLITAFKKLGGANKQLVSVGKHLGNKADSNTGKQLAGGYPQILIIVILFPRFCF